MKSIGDTLLQLANNVPSNSIFGHKDPSDNYSTAQKEANNLSARIKSILNLVLDVGIKLEYKIEEQANAIPIYTNFTEEILKFITRCR